jgi:two-component sensor histidine kinase
MNAIVLLNLLGLILYACTLGVVLLTLRQKRVPAPVGIFAVLLMIGPMFVCASNILEHLNITPLFDEYEGFARDIFAFLFLLFLYEDSMHRELRRRARSERQIQADLVEKTALLREIHHRVKNNMQIVSSMLSLQSTRRKDERLTSCLNIAQSRILSIASVHEIIYASKNLSHLRASEFIKSIIFHLTMIHHPDRRNIDIRDSLDPEIYLPVDLAVPVGLIVNELVANAMQHAFPETPAGSIEVSLGRTGERIQLRVADSGSGMATEEEGELTPQGLGMMLVRDLAIQIDAKMFVNAASGTTVTVAFPLPQGEGQ